MQNQNLITLIQNSKTLSKKLKKKFLKKLESLNDEEKSVLIAILNSEKTQTDSIEKEFNQQIKNLSIEFKQIVEDFNNAKIPKAIHESSEKVHYEEMKQAEAILEKLDN